MTNVKGWKNKLIQDCCWWDICMALSHLVSSLTIAKKQKWRKWFSSILHSPYKLKLCCKWISSQVAYVVFMGSPPWTYKQCFGL
jgi:hypothetical protein